MRQSGLSTTGHQNPPEDLGGAAEEGSDEVVESCRLGDSAQELDALVLGEDLGRFPHDLVLHQRSPVIRLDASLQPLERERSVGGQNVAGPGVLVIRPEKRDLATGAEPLVDLPLSPLPQVDCGLRGHAVVLMR